MRSPSFYTSDYSDVKRYSTYKHTLSFFMIVYFSGLNVGSKLSTAESSSLDDFEKTGAISDLLLEVCTRPSSLVRR